MVSSMAIAVPFNPPIAGAPTKGPIPIDTTKIYDAVAGTVGTVGQTIQSGVASLTSPSKSRLA